MILENHSYRFWKITRIVFILVTITRIVLFIYIFCSLRIAVSYRTVFVSSSNRTGLYEVFSLFCTGYTGPFVGSTLVSV